jgi:hypothetical protein
VGLPIIRKPKQAMENDKRLSTSHFAIMQFHKNVKFATKLSNKKSPNEINKTLIGTSRGTTLKPLGNMHSDKFRSALHHNSFNQIEFN